MNFIAVRNTSFKVTAVTLAAVFAGWLFISHVAGAAEKPKAPAPAAAPAPAPTKKETKKIMIVDPNDPTSVIYLDTSGKLAGTGDPTKPVSEAWRAGQSWHPQALAGTALPKDKYGLVDWAKAVKGNIINPKHSIDPQAEELPPLDMDVVIPAKGDFVNDVTYPHAMHTYWLSCDVCHPKIFQPARGENKMSMVAIAKGEWCGKCHGKVAFPLTDCARCHNVPKAAKKK